MIRGIYLKIFIWFTAAALLTSGAVFLITVATHSQSLGPSWMIGVLDQYARSAVDIYVHGGKPRLEKYLDDIEDISFLQSTLFDPHERRSVTIRRLRQGRDFIVWMKAGRNRRRLAVGGNTPCDLVLSEIRRHVHYKQTPLAAGQKVRRLAAIRSARLDPVVRTDGDIQILPLVAIEIT